MSPTLAHGKICNLQLPAGDIAESAEFYAEVLGWLIRERDDGTNAFDDGVGEVSGTWVLGRAPHPGDGLTVHIMVDNVTESIAAVVAHGGQLVEGIGAHHPEITAKISDPAGNVLGLYQERGA